MRCSDWRLDRPDRWSNLEYALRDGQFDVVYFSPDEIEPKEYGAERRKRSLPRHFGEKSIVHPPVDLDDEVQSYDL